eukprot:6198322-Pleurochrysis_carterae.AAC.2
MTPFVPIARNGLSTNCRIGPSFGHMISSLPFSMSALCTSLNQVFSSVAVERKVPTDAHILGHGMSTLRCASRSDQAFSEFGGDVSGVKI